MTAQVTGIVTPRAPSKRRVIELDGEAWRTTSSAVVRVLKLGVGDMVDPDSLAALIDAEEPSAAREAALRLLGYRERSTHELTTRLIEDGYPALVADAVAARLTESELLDDRRFTESLVHSAVRGRGFGRARIARMLSTAGIEESLIEESLDEAAPPEGELARATALAARLAGHVSTVDQLAGRLIRRGYGPGIAFSAARTALGSDHENPL